MDTYGEVRQTTRPTHNLIPVADQNLLAAIRLPLPRTSFPRVAPRIERRVLADLTGQIFLELWSAKTPSDFTINKL